MTDAEHDGLGPELEALDAFLESDAAPEESFSLPELDGFLTALAIGPGEAAPPQEWLPLVFGGAPRASADPQTADRIEALILGRLAEVAREVEAGEPRPVFASDEDGRAVADDWCAGFMSGVSLRAEAWGELLDEDGPHADEATILLAPILQHLFDERGEPREEAPDEDEAEELAEAAEAIPQAILGIADWWASGGPPPSPLVKPAKVGRNDPCPCGSGRKSKKCCGQAQ